MEPEKKELLVKKMVLSDIHPTQLDFFIGEQDSINTQIINVLNDMDSVGIPNYFDGYYALDPENDKSKFRQVALRNLEEEERLRFLQMKEMMTDEEKMKMEKDAIDLVINRLRSRAEIYMKLYHQNIANVVPKFKSCLLKKIAFDLERPSSERDGHHYLDKRKMKISQFTNIKNHREHDLKKYEALREGVERLKQLK